MPDKKQLDDSADKHSCCHNQGDPTARLTDPVCGMAVTTDSEHHYAYRNTDYYFCCGGCQEKFAADPGHYLNPPARQTDAASTAMFYICPMCPEVRQQGPYF